MELDRQQLLPAIVFLFSRRGCEQAVFTLHAAGVSLTSSVGNCNEGCIRLQESPAGNCNEDASEFKSRHGM